MKAPSRKASSCMTFLLRPECSEGKRQAVAPGKSRHRIDMTIAQALDEALVVAGLEIQILGCQPPAGENGEGLEIGHAAQMGRLVVGAEQFDDLETVAPMTAIGRLHSTRRQGIHEELAAELVATRPIGPPQLEDEIEPLLDDGGRRVPVEGML